MEQQGVHTRGVHSTEGSRRSMGPTGGIPHTIGATPERVPKQGVHMIQGYCKRHTGDVQRMTTCGEPTRGVQEETG